MAIFAPTDPALTEYLMFQSLNPTDIEAVHDAVSNMNDWTAEQLEGFLSTIKRREFESVEFYEPYLYLAEIALKVGRADLTTHGVNVAETICKHYPVMADWLMRHIEGLDRVHKRKQSSAQTFEGYVYLLKSPTGAYKIGRTKDPTNRLKTFEVKLPFEVDYVCVIQSNDMYGLEADLHAYYADKRINGEWFALTSDDVEQIKEMAT